MRKQLTPGKILTGFSLILLLSLSGALAHTPEEGPALRDLLGDDAYHGLDQAIVVKQEPPFGTLASPASVNGWLYITAQPDPETLGSLKERGFVAVINIRSADEMTFDEKARVEADGLAYYHHPLLRDGAVVDSAVTDIAAAVKRHEGRKILLHCSSGNRAALWLGAHLVRDRGYDPEQAIMLARRAGITKDSMEEILRAYLARLNP